MTTTAGSATASLFVARTAGVPRTTSLPRSSASSPHSRSYVTRLGGGARQCPSRANFTRVASWCRHEDRVVRGSAEHQVVFTFSAATVVELGEAVPFAGRCQMPPGARIQLVTTWGTSSKNLSTSLPIRPVAPLRRIM